jgi:hypothetical protein
MESDGASKWGYFKIDKVPNFKLKISTSLVSIALVVALGNSQVLPDLIYLFFGILDLSGAKERSFS